jgi:lysozyme family protein
MDQEAWNQIYSDLERDIAALSKRGGSVSELDVVLAIDKARFAMDRGDSDEAIALIQGVEHLLRSGDGAVTRGGATSAGIDRLEALEDNLHSTTRLGSARLEIVGEEEEEPTRAASQNTKVNKSIKYDDVKDEILRMWNACQIRPEKNQAVRREADRVVANRKVYEAISQETQVPWWFIGLIHGMECSFSLGKHLHNGDSLKARTWQVPAGRPKDGSPPFTFDASAIDALQVDGFAGKTDWPLAMVLFRLERYNGFGYRKKFGFASPYLWSYTNHFSSGKYVKDGVFDANATSKQCGAAAMLRDLVQRGIVTVDEKQPEAVVAVAPKPAPAPVAVPVPAPAGVPQPVQVAVSELAAASAPSVPALSVPAPAAAPVPQPVAQPAAPAAAPKPVVAAPVAVPVASPGPIPAPIAVPAAAPPAAPVPPASVMPVAAPAVSIPAAAPATVPPVHLPAPAQAAPVPAPGPVAAPTPVAAVSPAVAAALAELAKRPK